METKYKRILLKLSGEALSGEKGYGYDQAIVSRVAEQIVAVHNLGVEVGIVIGGGNFWRGRQGTEMNRVTADQMGMLATVMNSLMMMDAIEQKGVGARVQTAVSMPTFAEPLVIRKAIDHLKEGKVVLFGAGTGNPFCSTDTACVLRACEIQADVVLMAKNVDGIYDSDPKTNPNAKKYEKMTYSEILEKKLKVIDLQAATMCIENNFPTLAFGLDEENSIVKAVCGEKVGTIIEVK